MRVAAVWLPEIAPALVSSKTVRFIFSNHERVHVQSRRFRMTTQNLNRAGEPVPEAGIYAVVHDGHRASHEVTFRKGEVFPPCARCGTKVRFKLVVVGSTALQPRARKARRKGSGR